MSREDPEAAIRDQSRDSAGEATPSALEMAARGGMTSLIFEFWHQESRVNAGTMWSWEGGVTWCGAT